MPPISTIFLLAAALGQVLVSNEAPPAHPAPQTSSSNPTADVLPATPVTDDERASILITGYDLDLHLIPSDSREEAHALLTVRNTSAHPLTRIALQISSTLTWESLRPGTFTQSPLADDADHTGYAHEAVLTLPSPLAPGASITLDTFFSGQIEQSSARLDVLGAPAAASAASEWDSIQPTTDLASTALRGFGNVLWYPVAAPAPLLGDTNKLPVTIARQRAAGASASMRLHLSIQYAGDPPDAAILNGRLESLLKLPDEQTTLVADTQGIATADFPSAPVGFRAPSLFLSAQPAVTSSNQLLSVISPNPEIAAPWRDAADLLQPFFAEVFGPAPLTPVILLDHPGQPYTDGALLVTPLNHGASADVLIRPLTHAWFAVPGAGNAWLDQGLPEFLSLLWTEHTRGREAALAELGHASLLLALSEPAPEAGSTPAPGDPLTSTTDDLRLRLKSASVLWQLRDILGDAPFREGLLAFRHTVQLNPSADARAFQLALERASGKQLDWFFRDWVYRDPGLPDLAIGQVTPRPLPATPGHPTGFLVAIEVRNSGDAVAEVPVTVRSGPEAGTLSATERLRVPAHGSASTRILFEGTPETVTVNDGSVPELRTPNHTMEIRSRPQS